MGHFDHMKSIEDSVVTEGWFFLSTKKQGNSVYSIQWQLWKKKGACVGA